LKLPVLLSHFLEGMAVVVALVLELARVYFIRIREAASLGLALVGGQVGLG